VVEGGGALNEPSGSLEFHPEAEAELRAAARYYEVRQPGLGDDFLREVERATVVAVEHPAAGTPLGSGFSCVAFPTRLSTEMLGRTSRSLPWPTSGVALVTGVGAPERAFRQRRDNGGVNLPAALRGRSLHPGR
jgi:hypothetical protein